MIMAAPVELLCLLGAGISLWDKPRIINLYVLIYMFFILLSPSPTYRYLIPMLPFLFYFVCIGAEHMIEKVRSYITPATTKLIYIGITVYILLYIGIGIRYMLKDIPEEHRSEFGAYPIKLDNPDLQRLGFWLKNHTPEGEPYLCDYMPSVIDAVTQRRGYTFTDYTVADEVLRLLDKWRIKYILVDKLGEYEYVYPSLVSAIKAYPREFILIKDEKKASLYKFIIVLKNSPLASR